MRRFLTVVLAAGLVVGGALAAAWTASSATTASKPHLTDRRILEIALTAAARAGDPTPTLIQHSKGTRYRANLVDSGDVVPGSRWSYLIAVRGHFILNDAPIPPGAHAPKGTVLTLIVDARTGEVTDSGLSNRYPHLANLGPVHTDLRRKPAHHTTAKVGKGDGGTVYAVDIQAVYDRKGNPSLVANFFPDGSLAIAHWEICSPRNVSVCRPENSRSQFLEPGPTLAGTVFQATATFGGRTYSTRTATWLGQVRATARPWLEGQPRVGRLVRPRAARWRGGWPPDRTYRPQPGIMSAGRQPGFDSLSVEACRTRSGSHCINLTPQGKTRDFAQQPVRVARRFIGWYLFAFDEHFAADTGLAEPAYGSPADIPPLTAGPTIARSEPAGPVRS